ncbi:MAG: class I SAM-dependent methyltransferase [Candidatus Doudnabacteria bacterium]
MTDQSTIDAYNQNSERWAKRQRKGHNLAHEFLEKPAIYAKLPALSGMDVLCLGCGSGEECAYLKEQGANKVLGIDISKGLIEQARYTYPQVEFKVMDMENLSFEDNSFDFIYSSLALHYSEDWNKVLKPAHKLLKPGGKFLFSTHHPIKWGAQHNEENNKRLTLMGYSRSEDGSFEVYGDYLNSHKITDNLMDGLKVSYYHKPFSEMVKEIVQSGFDIVDLVEPKAIASAKKEKVDFYEVHQKIPLFIIWELQKINK